MADSKLKVASSVEAALPLVKGSYWREWFKGRNLIYTIIFLIICFIILFPILLLFIQSFKVQAPDRTYFWGWENWVTAFTQPELSSALINTINLTVVRQLIGIVIGVFIAWLLARTDLPGRNWFEFGFWVTFFMPVLPMIQAWLFLAHPNRGLINQVLADIPFLSWLHFNLYSWWGIVFLHLVTHTIAVKVMLLTPAFRNLDSALEEASRVHGATNFRTLMKVVFPIMWPIILVVSILSIIRGLESFEIELILGGPAGIEVFTTMIFRMIQDVVPNYGAATALSSIILIIILPLIWLQARVNRKASNYSTISGKFRTQPYKLGKWRWPLFVLVLLFVLGLTVLPIVCLLIGSFMTLFGHFDIAEPWTLENWSRVLSNPNFLDGLSNTLIISLSTAVLSVLIFSIIAYIIVRTGFRGRQAMDFVVWLPSAIPGIVISLGILWFVIGTPVVNAFYGTIGVMVLAILISGITTGVQVLKSNLVQLGKELEEASWSSGASWLYTFRRIVLPIIAPALAVVAVMGFTLGARATSQVVLLDTQGNRPLAVTQLFMMTEGGYEEASVVGIIILLLTLGVALVARAIGLNLGIRNE
jgi:iron(III) transport system permease protein